MMDSHQRSRLILMKAFEINGLRANSRDGGRGRSDLAVARRGRHLGPANLRGDVTLHV